MRKDSIMRSIILATLISMILISIIGCQGKIIQPNSEGVFAFNIWTTEFTYRPGTRTGTMTVHEPTEIDTWVNIKKADGWEGRRGVSLWLYDTHRTASYDDYYAWGEELRIVIRRDGIETINYVFLGDPDSPGPAKIVIIIQGADDDASITEWFNSQNWDTYYSTGGGKTNIIVRTDDKEFINFIRSGKISVGNINTEVVIDKVSLKTGILDAGVDQTDYVEIELNVASF